MNTKKLINATVEVGRETHTIKQVISAENNGTVGQQNLYIEFIDENGETRYVKELPDLAKITLASEQPPTDQEPEPTAQDQPKRTYYKIPDHTTSKAEEIAIIESIAKNLTEASYLGNLLTPEAVQWIREKIEADAPPNLCRYLYDAEAEAAAFYQDFTNADNERRQLLKTNAVQVTTITNLETTLKHERDEITKLIAMLNAANENLGQAEEKVKQLADDQKKNRQEIKALEKLLSDTSDKHAAVVIANNRPAIKIKAQHQEITELKAKLYDHEQKIDALENNLVQLADQIEAAQQ